MSLSDLKKKKGHSSKSKDFTIDEFISDAENYALGKPNIVSADDSCENSLTIEQAILLAKQHLEHKEHPSAKSVNKKSKKPFRKATFTLSEEAIAQLAILSEKSDLAKSHIIRLLINELCDKEQQDKLHDLIEQNRD